MNPIMSITGALWRAMPLPLTGACALQVDVAWQDTAWLVVFLSALADEADDAMPT